MSSPPTPDPASVATAAAHRRRWCPPPAAAILAIWAAVALPLAWQASATAAAALRATTGMDLAAAWALATAIALALGLAALVAAWRRRAGLARASGWAALAAATTTATLGALVWWRLIGPVRGELVTVGGGDLGHHLHLAALFAGPLPGAYAGFTTWHAAWWLALHRWDPASALAAMDAAAMVGKFGHAAAVAAGGLWAGAIVQRASAQGRAAAWAALATLLALVIAGLERSGLASWHYHEAEGFVSHLATRAPLLAAAAVVVGCSDARTRLVGLAATTVALRFTHGVNVGEHAAALASAAWAARQAPWAPADRRERWWRLAMAGLTVAAAAVALAVALRLVSVLAKPGAMHHPPLADRAVVLALACALAPAASWLDQPALARWLGWVFGAPLALVLMHLAWPALPREYYLYKHGVAAQWLALWLAPGLAGLAVARAWRLPARRLAAALVVALAAALPWAMTRGASFELASYAERSDGAAAWQLVEPARDRTGARAIDAVRAAGGDVVAALHPHWPITSVWGALVEGLDQPHPAAPDDLQRRRLALLRDGPPLAPGSEGRPRCVIFAAAPDRLREWAQHDARHGGRVGARVLAWAADPGRGCTAPELRVRASHPELACWVCLPPLATSKAQLPAAPAPAVGSQVPKAP